MYGPKWPFLLIYGSHDMRHTGFLRVDGLSTDPRNLGRHTWVSKTRDFTEDFSEEFGKSNVSGLGSVHGTF